jgi:peptidoglycan/LPS O-acetylase OafA/YrhL
MCTARHSRQGVAILGEYLTARFARIYPAHLAMMLAFLAYVAVLGSAGFSFNEQRYRPEPFLLHVTLLDAWNLDRSLSWNHPAWSISAEFAAYLAFPLIVGPLLRLSRSKAALLLGALLIAFVLINGPARLTTRTWDFSFLRICRNSQWVFSPTACDPRR